MSTYLSNEDCISFVKKKCDTKEQLCNIEYHDIILDAVFGEEDKGCSVSKSMTGDQYETL